jgi:hypothetical protein
MATKQKAERMLVVHDGGEPEDNPTKGLPLFQGEEQIAGIAVYRMEPVEEGTIGTLPPDADEEMIRRRWGGGIYKISAKGVDGKYKGGRTITIGGDPKFESRDARRRYQLKMAGLDDIDEAPPLPAAAPAAQGMGVAEVLALLTQGHAQQLQMMRLQVEAQKRDADEREAKARREADEREARTRREGEESRERDRQFNATMLSLVKSDAKAAGSSGIDMVTALMQGLKLGRQLGAGAEENPTDPVSLLIANLPGIIEHGKGLVQAGMGHAPQPNPAAPQGPRLTLSGPIATKMQARIQELMGKGYSREDALAIAEAAINGTVDALAQVPNAPTTPSPSTEAAASSPEAPPAPSSPPPRVPVRKRTAARARATHVR